MFELTAETVRDYLVRQGRLRVDEPVDVRLLAGGVSNVVFLVTPRSQPPFVLKQSREQLRTQADWFSRLDRVFREIEAQRILSQLLRAGSVPGVLFEDRENYCYAMTAVRADHDVWKRQLLSGRIDPDVFVRAGSLLGDIHAKTAGQPQVLAEPHDTTVFFELRVDPFYRRIAAVHPAIKPAVDRMIEEMNDHAECLVHADFSPKNLLVHPDGLTLVDYETVHFGDPAFDLGFFFSHLWLKAVALPAVRPPLVAGIHAAWDAYRTQLGQTGTTAAIPFNELSRRAVLHLAACLLSRVDGKSPVDYLNEKAQRAFVRNVTLQWFAAPPSDFDDAFRELESEISNFRSQI